MIRHILVGESWHKEALAKSSHIRSVVPCKHLQSNPAPIGEDMWEPLHTIHSMPITSTRHLDTQRHKPLEMASYHESGQNLFVSRMHNPSA